MRNLACKISEEREKEKDVIGVLLFGSVAKGDIHARSDVDLVFVKDSGKDLIRRKEFVVDGIKIDSWEHSYSFYERLFEKKWRPEEMFLYSLFLNVLQGCNVLYDRESKFEVHKKNAMEWRWPENCKDLIRNRSTRALNNYKSMNYDNFEKIVYVRKLFLLDTCRRLLEIGKPVSVRNKDYYLICKKHFSLRDFESVFGRIPDRETLKLLLGKTIEIFHNEVRDKEPWTELEDAKNHLSNKEDFLATISLQNGAYYLGCVGLSNRNVERENKGFLYPESEIELIRQSREHWTEFYDIYRKVHNADAWQEKDINALKTSETLA
jgi:predicted nucleotidyltransferase